MSEIVLHGHWLSPFTYRVIWALKLKEVPYEYIEENVFYHKREILSQLNPVYNRTPVLVHRGAPLSESMVIVEYINEVFPVNPLLPRDAYQMARARFWVHFMNSNDHALFKPLFTSGEEQERSVKEFVEIIEIIEEHLMGNTEIIGGEKIGIVDIAYGVLAFWLDIVEEVARVTLLDPTKFPKLCCWINNFLGDKMVKDNLPDREKVIAIVKHRREVRLSSSV